MVRNQMATEKKNEAFENAWMAWQTAMDYAYAHKDNELKLILRELERAIEKIPGATE